LVVGIGGVAVMNGMGDDVWVPGWLGVEWCLKPPRLELKAARA
jgi:hypothetical protein